MASDTIDAAVDETIGKTVDAGGIVTNYHEAGEGEPMVLIHGSGPGVTAWANWCDNIPVFAEHFHVYAYDVLGFGHTQPMEHYTWDRVIQHLSDFLDAMNIENPVLVGNSMGGLISLMAATRMPDRFRGMVLMGSPGPAMPTPKAIKKRDTGIELTEEMIGKLLKRFAYDPKWVPDDLIRARFELTKLPGAGVAFNELLEEGFGLTDEELQSITIPTHVIHGREDLIIPVEYGLKIQKEVPNCDMTIFGKCGHWTQVERAPDFNRIVTDFALKLAP